MGKLIFIIPKVLDCVGIFLKILLLIVLDSIFFVGSVAADTHEFGCRFGNRIFQELDLNHPSPTNFQYDSDGNGNPNGYAVLDEKCDDGSILVCTLYEHDEITIHGYGILADHSIDYCPIDNNLPILFIFTLSLYFIKLRREVCNIL